MSQSEAESGDAWDLGLQLGSGLTRNVRPVWNSGKVSSLKVHNYIIVFHHFVGRNWVHFIILIP